MKALGSVTLCPSGFVRVTLTVPPGIAGVVTSVCVELETVTDVLAALPKVTVAPDWKFAPVMVTVVPPGVNPLVGEMLLMFGGGGI